MTRNYLLFVLVCLLIYTFAGAQQPYAIQINDKNGLPSNAVYNLLQDKRGFLWISSDEGLCRFDGTQFVTYKSDEQTSISGSNIVEDVYGRIWYQNFDGYCYYVENDTLHQLNQNKPTGYYPIGITKDYMYLIQEKGVDVYDLKTLKLIKTIPIVFNELNHTASSAQHFNLIDKNRIYKVDTAHRVESALHNLDTREKVRQIYTAKNVIYILSKLNEQKKMYVFNNLKKLNEVAIHTPEFIQGFGQFEKNTWLLTSKGIHLVSNNGSKHLFPNYSISCAIRDRQNNYWIGTTDKGILLVPNINNQYTSLLPYNPSVLLENKNGFDIFTKQDEWLTINEELTSVRPVILSKAKTNVYYAFRDPINSNLFVSSYGTSFYPKSNPNQLEFNNTATKEIVRIDESFYAYASSGICGLIKYSNSAPESPWNKLFQLNAINENRAHLLKDVRGKSVAYDSINNQLYFVTNIGLYKQDTHAIREILHNGKRISCTKIISCGKWMLVHSPKGIVYRFENDRLKEVINALPNIQIEEIKRIKKTGPYVCLISDRKVLFITLDYPIRVAGSLPLQLNASEISDIALTGNNVFVLTHSGIIKTNLQTETPKFSESNFVITSIIINGTRRTISETYQLPFNQNNITINFAILDFVRNNLNEVYISINDEGWNHIAPQSRSIDFASLAPGTYTLRFKINDQIINTTQLQFVIQKPFWQQSWFQLSMVIATLLLIYGYYKWQINLLVKKNKLATEKITLENRLNKSILTSIKSQMNPHFFYNALNTIQSYIFSNDKKNASNYLSKFSKLTRMILEMSEKEVVRLSEELESLRLYLELEKMRFEDNLNYQISISSNIDTDLIKIPPMLIQPYVENAIKHGLLHVKGEKILTISFTKEQEGFLKVKVDDNGIGRKKSMELNKIRSDKHDSFSTNANETRLSILSSGKSNIPAIEILDKETESGVPLGTLVIINIPIS